MNSFTYVRGSGSGANIKCQSLQGVALGEWHVPGIEARLVGLECKKVFLPNRFNVLKRRFQRQTVFIYMVAEDAKMPHIE